ncbi:YbjN domain-containing protein [Ferrimonas lipolytica]|uniref:YbjN domain-containing protein n=1 Tax=Ferrimonas lipolytica TaxID=2724191 RepID=A0A6H1UEN9_9GAMM|nr:YbjN domain-containing protein [Ferrimonas lipolytica]QIZ76676.1 YbjN domain-containing protein [Ferrimonas lipolytica]
MATLPIPDHSELQSWLKQFEIDFYHCGNCEGMHLPILQDNPVIYDAKVEIEGDFLYLTASIELRPTGLMQAYAELSRLNCEFPTLKIFVEMIDESLPRLLMCHNLALIPGISKAQFEFFVRDGIDQMHQVAAEVGKLNINFNEEPVEEIQIETVPTGLMMH